MSSPAFAEALPFVLRWEGGFVDHPADPRGATNKGVTQAVYDAWRSQQGKPQRSVRQIEDGEMHAIYESGYWQPARTNYHVINSEGTPGSVRPGNAEVVFEADDPGRAYGVAELLWTSPVKVHDAALLRLKELPTNLRPLTIGNALPTLPPIEEKKRPRVYVIGYPGGRELAFSFHDNELIDHEGPDTGKPQTKDVWRVQYRAPTEGGSSGSPVFEDRQWHVIALHHMGGKFGMPRLNGLVGSYAANEGLAMATLIAAVKAESSANS